METTPLAARVRPESLDEYIGQEHLVGHKGSLRKVLDLGQLHSMILWGPPGTGKTTLAHLLAKVQQRPFYELSAIHAGVKEVREVIEKAKQNGGLFTQKNPLLFIDEIHRFSKAQQDSLLRAVEQGMITLIGATTENPSFEVINALLSRCQVYTLKALDKEALEKVLKNALKKDRYLQELDIRLEEVEAILQLSGGDARKLLSILELVVQSMSSEKVIRLTNARVQELIETNRVLFDKNGEFHYDIISAFIKSLRGSDPHAAVYWLARMLNAGEDIKFIARRMLILASEDIGNANPNALLMAKTTFDAVAIVGMPEARIILSQCATYLASSPKSNAAYLAINKAQATVDKTGNLSVPLHLRNAPTALMKELDYGKNYLYPHDYPNHSVAQEYMPDELQETPFYIPASNPAELRLRDYLKNIWGDKYPL
ncbi:MAG: replication-associated recombination protein A [Flavobacteriaceae bacterium]